MLGANIIYIVYYLYSILVIYSLCDLSNWPNQGLASLATYQIAKGKDRLSRYKIPDIAYT